MLNDEVSSEGSALAALAAAALLLGAAPARADGVLEGLRHHTTLASTITDNGDLNPYAVVVAPATSGKIHQGDVLVDNFNNQSNLQGTGGTIIDYNPSTRSTTLFAKLPQNLPQCPGGIGLTHRDDHAEQRLGDRRQHAERRRHDRDQGRRLPAGVRFQRPARHRLVGLAHQRSLGQHGRRRQRREGDAVRQHVGLRRSRPGQARSGDRPARHRQQGDGAAHPAGDPGERTAEGRRARR